MKAVDLLQNTDLSKKSGTLEIINLLPAYKNGNKNYKVWSNWNWKIQISSTEKLNFDIWLTY